MSRDIIRRQLTLFIHYQNEIIEKIRSEFNPTQFNLIAAHVTLCREDELDPIERVIENIESIYLSKPIKIEFDAVEKFYNGQGVRIPAKENSIEFDELRKLVLKGLIDFPTKHHPHVTLIHPRNATRTDSIFEQIREFTLPTELYFDEMALIEQRNGGVWNVIRRIHLNDQKKRQNSTALPFRM